MTLVVESPGGLTLVQDAGRPGAGSLGVSPSGAFDREAFRQVNALLGNPTGSPVLEVLGGGLVLTARARCVVAVTGAAAPVTVRGRQVVHGRATLLGPGDTVHVGPPVSGLRTYVGVAGGFDVTQELGSASTDTLAGLGPRPVASGDLLAVGPAGAIPSLEDVLPLDRAGDLTLDVVLGPRDDWFTTASVRALLETPWLVSPRSDRVGVRLDGPALARSTTSELPSEPCVRGSVQVAADGQPIVFGPDHPVTGGYPVIAVVVDRHTDRLAQAGPGRVVRFRRVPAP